MGQTLEFLSLGWVGTTLGAFGIILAIAFYMKSRQRARLASQYDGISLVGGQDAVFPNEVEIEFSGHPVPRVTLSRIIFWNSGSKTIDGGDVIKSDGLCVDLPKDSILLRAAVTEETREVNGWDLVAYSKGIPGFELKFNFLDPGDGAAIEIIHTGIAGKLKVTGTVKGIPEGVVDFGRAYPLSKGEPPKFWPRVFSRNTSIQAAVATGVTFILAGIFRPQLAEWRPGVFGPPDLSSYETIDWFCLFLGLTFFVPATVILWKMRRRFPPTLIPKRDELISWGPIGDDDEK